jgi:hypothetical protein
MVSGGALLITDSQERILKDLMYNKLVGYDETRQQVFSVSSCKPQNVTLKTYGGSR